MKKDSSGIVALQRLRTILADEKCEIDEETMSSIKREVGNVILKYVDIEPDNVNIKIILKEYKKKKDVETV